MKTIKINNTEINFEAVKDLTADKFKEMFKHVINDTDAAYKKIQEKQALENGTKKNKPVTKDAEKTEESNKKN